MARSSFVKGMAVSLMQYGGRRHRITKGLVTERSSRVRWLQHWRGEDNASGPSKNAATSTGLTSSVKDNIFDEQYWINRIANNDCRWHMEEVNPKLLEYKDLIFFKASPHKVFIPLCGKSMDMKWFHDQGCYVVGADCAPLILREFFEEHELKYSVKECAGDAKVYSSEDGRIILYNCNLFGFSDVSKEKDFDIIWDRGSLVAVNTNERKQYVELMASLVASDFRYLLDTFEYDPTVYGGPPKTMSDEELEELYVGQFTVKAIDKVECDMSKYDVEAGKSRTTLLTPL